MTYRTGWSVESVIDEHIIEQGLFQKLLSVKCRQVRSVLDKHETALLYANLYGEVQK